MSPANRRWAKIFETLRRRTVMQIGEKYLIGGSIGTIVAIVDEGLYSDRYPETEWADVLKSGILVEDENAGLIHYPDLNDLTVEKLVDR